MELILKETISSLGHEGDVVTVKPGHGRNYLLPQGKAIMATKENLAILEQNRAEIEAKVAKERAKAEAVAKKLSGLNLIIEQLAGDDERLFGSVTSTDICAKLAEKGIALDKKQIVLPDPIKTLGENKLTVKVGFAVTAEITVTVAPLTEK